MDSRNIGSHPQSEPSLRGVAWGLLVVLAGALAILLIVKALILMTFLAKPGEQTAPAAANAYVARRVQQGGALYADWRQRPHVPSWYGPALYLPVAYLGRWMGSDVQGLYMIGRWISLVATLGTAGLIVWMGRRDRSVPASLCTMMAVVFFISDEVFARFDMSFRADAPACFFTILGLSLWVCLKGKIPRYGSAAAFLVAFLYKQSSVIGPASVVLWLWLNGRRKDALTHAAITGGAIVGAWGFLELITHGQYSLNTVQALKGNTTLRAIPFMFFEIVRPSIVPMTLAVYATVVEWSRRQWNLLTIALVLSVVLTAASTYRDGSSVNYYMPSLAIACALAAGQLGQWWQALSADRSSRTAGIGAALCVLALSLGILRYVPEACMRLVEMPVRAQMFQQRDQQQKAFADLIRNLSAYLNGLHGPVLCQFNDMVLHCPRSVLVDTCTFTSMADVGAFDDRPLIEDIRQGRIEAIVIDRKAPRMYQSTEFFSRRWYQAMDRRYELVYQNDTVEIFRPAGRPAVPPPTLGAIPH